MIVKTLIAANPTFKKEKPSPDVPFLEVAEFFCDTIQGENFVGWPSAFLRVQHCSLSCTWCDTQEVWRYGNPYTFPELFDIMEKNEVIEKFKQGQHLVLTGGSPVKQQNALIVFIKEFIDRYGFKPFIEIENECTIMPKLDLIAYVDIWNNSPKLRNSGNVDIIRYQPELLKYISSFTNSWFKFVIEKEQDWQEIQNDFLDKELIYKNQVVLMPLGATRKELHANKQMVLEMAITHNVRYSTREQVEIWDLKTGV